MGQRPGGKLHGAQVVAAVLPHLHHEPPHPQAGCGAPVEVQRLGKGGASLVHPGGFLEGVTHVDPRLSAAWLQRHRFLKRSHAGVQLAQAELGNAEVQPGFWAGRIQMHALLRAWCVVATNVLHD